MQTFLPSSVISECAEMLDSKRLNKQILEAYQILKVLSGASPSGAWRNHPAALMWKGHEYALFSYANIMITEAANRGIKVDKNLSNLNELKNNYRVSWGKGIPSWAQNNNT
ncbi:MAG: pyrimidine dimer DNA glycosylase/endonuclease V, partial [Minisyncoccia bacterium]